VNTSNEVGDKDHVKVLEQHRSPLRRKIAHALRDGFERSGPSGTTGI
jgi:hypothetical protein